MISVQFPEGSNNESRICLQKHKILSFVLVSRNVIMQIPYQDTVKKISNHEDKIMLYCRFGYPQIQVVSAAAL